MTGILGSGTRSMNSSYQTLECHLETWSGGWRQLMVIEVTSSPYLFVDLPLECLILTMQEKIILMDMSMLNSSTAHMVAVATDSGIPPRQATVPVIVHFPESVVQTAGSSWAPGGTSFMLMVIFGALLGILGLIIVMLILYIYKHKRPKSGNRTVPKNYMNNPIQHEKLSPATTVKIGYGYHELVSLMLLPPSKISPLTRSVGKQFLSFTDGCCVQFFSDVNTPSSVRGLSSVTSTASILHKKLINMLGLG
ncbi:hypothetical protein L9F63_027494, partial [Diploptera punctata]